MPGFTGYALIGIGILHTLLGVAVFRPQILEIFQNTFSNKIKSHPARMNAFWFLFSGFLLILFGQLSVWMEIRLGSQLPDFLIWEILVLSVLGVILMPVSGFWLVLATAVFHLL